MRKDLEEINIQQEATILRFVQTLSTGVKRKVFVNRYTLRQHNLENFILLGNKLSYLLVYFNLILHLRKLWLNCGLKNNSLTLCMLAA